MDLCNANTTLIIAPRLYHYVKKFQFIEMIGQGMLSGNKQIKQQDRQFHLGKKCSGTDHYLDFISNLFQNIYLSSSQELSQCLFWLDDR